MLNYIAAFLTLAWILGPRAARAQDSGLLLGLHVVSEDSGASYRTYWIARESGAVRLVATGPDLLVPGRSGFWRVCLVSGQDISDGEHTEWDSLVVRPATPARGRCSVRDDPPTDAEREAARCNATSGTQIQFVGGNAVSLERHGESDCGAHYNGGTEVTLSSLDDGREIDLSKLVEPSRRAALFPATLKAAREAFADIGTVDTSDVEVEEMTGPRLSLYKRWTVERAPGHWRTVGQVYCSPYVGCGDGLRIFSIEFAAPRALVGHDELSPSLASIKTAFPNVNDAVSSPRRDMVVAMSYDSLFVFSVRDGKLGQRLLGLPVSGRIVMAQWAVGKFVPIWTAKLIPLLETPADKASDSR